MVDGAVRNEERRRNSLADYPIIQFSGTFAIYVSEFHPSLEGGRPSSAVSHPHPPSYRRAVGIFHFHLAEIVPARMPSCRALFLIEGPRGSRWP